MDLFAFSAKQVVVCFVFFFPQGFAVYLGQGSFLCLKCLNSFAKLHSNLKDNNRKSKVFLTGRFLSLVLVSQTVVFTLFISAAVLVLCNHYYNNLCTKIGHLCHFISQKAEIGHRCSHLNLAFKVILLHNYKILCESPYPNRDYFLSYKNLKK